MEQGAFAVEDLRLLAALAEAGTLAGAARRVGVNHASAWRRLGALEARLGVRLFDRARDGYAATPAGEAAIAAATRIGGELAELERRLAGQDVRPTGVVRITMPDTLIGLLTPMLAGFRRQHPGIVLETTTANAFFTLTRRDADVAFRPAAAAPDGLVARRLATVGTAPYASPTYLRDAAGRPLTGLQWLSPDDSLSHLATARWIVANVAQDRVVYRANSLLSLAAAARAGLSVAPLPCVVGDADPGLTRAGPPVPEWATPLWLLTHPDLRRTARVRAFLDYAAGRVARLRPFLEGTGPAPAPEGQGEP